MSAEADHEIDAELLRAIGHGVRLQILAALARSERAVGDIEALTGIAQPGLSQQLGVLRKADLVQTRREGKQVFYSLDSAKLEEARDIIAALLPQATGADRRLSPRQSPDPVRRTGGAAVFARITD